MAGYRQEQAAGVVVDYLQRRDRREDRPGKNGVTMDASLVDLRSVWPQLGWWVRARALEWITGEPHTARDAGHTLTGDQPELAEDVEALREAIIEAHAAEGGIVSWRGRQRGASALMRILDDTRAVRRIAKVMGTSQQQAKERQPLLTTARYSQPCAVCGRDIGIGQGIWIHNGRRWHEGCNPQPAV